MAYAALASLAQTIDLVLNHRRYSIYPDEKLQIASISNSLICLQAFLQDFPGTVDSLEGRARDTANRAEDTIEYFVSEQLQSRYRLFKPAMGPKVLKFEHYPVVRNTQLNNYFHKLRLVAEEIDSLAGEVLGIKNRLMVKNAEPRDFHATSSSSRLEPARKEAVVGLDGDLMAIKERLCGESSKLQIIPIFGMGGIGKTTLARNAYDDPWTIHHFHVRAWITVSQDYSAREILSCLLVSMNVLVNVESINEFMAEKVYKSLKGRRYLIVMDDMWSTEAWDTVKRIFPDDRNGSRVMITTRLSDMASYPDSCSPLHQMRFLDADQSWDLLKQKVFMSQDCPSELEDTGKKIAQGCKGLPLAIVLIGGLLSTVSKTRASWGEISKNVYLAVAHAKDGQFEKIFSLSYKHLPQHLRQCFLYLGVFPEDYEIRVSQLVKLWVAEGFFNDHQSKSPEDGAEEYFAELVKRSLVFVDTRKFDGKTKSFIIHDLVRDLCIRKAREESFQRRISISPSDIKCIANFYGPATRTIICVRPRGRLLHSLGNFILLRVLDVVDANVKSLPSQLFDLFHLRYLAFSHVVEIPGAILNLRNLQTLILYSRFVRLPMEIWRMPQLRHLVSASFGSLPDPRGALSALLNLQTLSRVRNFRCTEWVLKMIPNLKKLGVVYWAEKYDREYHLSNLVHLRCLEKLKVEVRGSFTGKQNLDLAFPRMLKKLTLRGCRLPWKHMNIVGSLPNLQALKLIDWACRGYVWETTQGEFRKLELLLINGSDLEHWITECSHFPVLKCLVLHRCWCLSEIPDGFGEIPTLELIEVMYGKTSLVASAKGIEEEQESYGNDTLEVRYSHESF